MPPLTNVANYNVLSLSIMITPTQFISDVDSDDESPVESTGGRWQFGTLHGWRERRSNWLTAVEVFSRLSHTPTMLHHIDSARIQLSKLVIACSWKGHNDRDFRVQIGRAENLNDKSIFSRFTEVTFTWKVKRSIKYSRKYLKCLSKSRKSSFRSCGKILVFLATTSGSWESTRFHLQAD